MPRVGQCVEVVFVLEVPLQTQSPGCSHACGRQSVCRAERVGNLPIYLSTYLSIYLSTYLYIGRRLQHNGERQKQPLLALSKM